MLKHPPSTLPGCEHRRRLASQFITALTTFYSPGNTRVAVSEPGPASGKPRTTRDGASLAARWERDFVPRRQDGWRGQWTPTTASPPSQRVALLQMKPWQFISAPEVFSYDVAADGKRSLINARLDESNAAPGAENSPNNDSWFG
jgi:hypothetical protein